MSGIVINSRKERLKEKRGRSPAFACCLEWLAIAESVVSDQCFLHTQHGRSFHCIPAVDASVDANYEPAFCSSVVNFDCFDGVCLCCSVDDDA